MLFRYMFSIDMFSNIRNSEIYNHWDIRETLLKDTELISTSDSEIVGCLYLKYGLTNEIIN